MALKFPFFSNDSKCIRLDLVGFCIKRGPFEWSTKIMEFWLLIISLYINVLISETYRCDSSVCDRHLLLLSSPSLLPPPHHPALGRKCSSTRATCSRLRCVLKPFSHELRGSVTNTRAPSRGTRSPVCPRSFRRAPTLRVCVCCKWHRSVFMLEDSVCVCLRVWTHRTTTLHLSFGKLHLRRTSIVVCMNACR